MKEFELTEENFAGCVDAATGKPIPKKGDVVLPEKVTYKGEECKLTGIKDGAFSWCKELTSVVINLWRKTHRLACWMKAYFFHLLFA